MPLTVGSVTIDSTGGVTKSDATGRLYDKMIARMTASYAAAGSQFPTGAASVPLKQGVADMANDFADWIISEIQNHALVRVTVETTDSGLQRMPASTTEDTNCKGPSVAKSLLGTVG